MRYPPWILLIRTNRSIKRQVISLARTFTLTKGIYDFTEKNLRNRNTYIRTSHWQFGSVNFFWPSRFSGRGPSVAFGEWFCWRWSIAPIFSSTSFHLSQPVPHSASYTLPFPTDVYAATIRWLLSDWTKPRNHVRTSGSLISCAVQVQTAQCALHIFSSTRRKADCVGLCAWWVRGKKQNCLKQVFTACRVLCVLGGRFKTGRFTSFTLYPESSLAHQFHNWTGEDFASSVP